MNDLKNKPKNQYNYLIRHLNFMHQTTLHFMIMLHNKALIFIPIGLQNNFIFITMTQS